MHSNICSQSIVQNMGNYMVQNHKLLFVCVAKHAQPLDWRAMKDLRVVQNVKRKA